MDLNEYKIKEFLGDALLKLVVGELIITSTKISRFQRSKAVNQVTELCCNDCLSIAAQELGLLPHPLDKTKLQSPLRPLKIYANAYEVIVYEIYCNQGMPAVKEFINRTLIKPTLK